jgi:hypothetical protein
MSQDTIIRPPAPVQPGPLGPDQPSSNPNTKKPKKVGRIVAAGLGGAAVVGLTAALVFMPKGESAPPVVPDGEPDGNEQVDNPTAGEYMTDLEELAEMTPEQITELATITVESVTGPDGNIDWELYAKKLNDVMLLGTVAGTTTAEAEEAYLNTNEASEANHYIADKYDDAFLDGFAVPELGLGGWEQTHLAFVGAARAAYLGNTGPVIRTLDLLSVEVSPDATNEGATFTMTQRTTDNFFSSGIYKATSPKDVEQIGRSTDVDLTYQSEAEAVVIDGNIYLKSINP